MNKTKALGIGSLCLLLLVGCTKTEMGTAAGGAAGAGLGYTISGGNPWATAAGAGAGALGGYKVGQELDKE